jgi:tetratricopeptide (TPR) repeat protein
VRKQLIGIRPDDLGLQAEYQYVEYARSGSWKAYDEWRPTLPKEAYLRFPEVRELDISRAIAGRDLSEVLLATNGVNRAVVLRAMGRRSESIEAARAALLLIDKLPSTSGQKWWAKARAHALLGERELAFAAHARDVDLNMRHSGPFVARLAGLRSADLHALLGDRDKTLAELSQQLKLPGARAHDLPVTLVFASLWDDPKFQALVNDPANNAPLPLDVTFPN